MSSPASVPSSGSIGAGSAVNQSVQTGMDFLGISDLRGEDLVKALEKALSCGGDFAEFFFEEVSATRAKIEAGKLDQLIDGTDRGAGLRVIAKNRTFFGYTTLLTPQSLIRLSETVADAARSGLSEKEEPRTLQDIEWQWSEQKVTPIARYRVQKPTRSTPLDEKVQIAFRIEKSARKELPDARQVTTLVGDSLRKFFVMNSDGLLSKDQKNYFQMVAQVVGEKDGRVESALESDGGYVGIEFLDEKSPEEIGRLAAFRVQTLLAAKPAPTGSMPVVMGAEAGGTMIHEAVGHGLEADLACNGLSVYQNKLGEKVASSKVTVIDDGTMEKRRGSYAFDDEGTPSKKNVLIEEGVLKSYLVDKLSALKFDLMATGNGRRESFRHLPIVRMTNTYVAPGTDDPQNILKETDWGIYVKSMGGGQVNTVTGDFVFAVTEGYLIEKGRLTLPIRGATLVGNGPQVISIVDRVGTDLGFATGTCGKDGQGAPVTDAQPTMRIPTLTVGGEVPVETYWSQPN